MNNPIKVKLAGLLQQCCEALFLVNLKADVFQIQDVNPEYEGDFTLVVFPLLKHSKGKPEETATKIGDWMMKNSALVHHYTVVKGFLNLSLQNDFVLETFNVLSGKHIETLFEEKKSQVMVEFSSPNTNKPLHLGHIRNILLGDSVSRILSYYGHEVVKTQIINDRGIHICKSMWAWLQYGEGKTPEMTGEKGDHFVGRYYVQFDKTLKLQSKALIESGMDAALADNASQAMHGARDLLVKWENNDANTLALWEKMNAWVYDGFEKTYQDLGAHFDCLYYESNTYQLGKKIVLHALEDGILYKKEDGSIWCNLQDHGLDEKLLLRKDGTSVYMTQDIGTAIQRHNDYPLVNKQIYTVGNEQDYHFKVLFILLEKLGYGWAKNNYHLSYGMIELPEGKMKSREGTVVDADDLIASMRQQAKKTIAELGKVDDLNAEELKGLACTIAMGALKYFILKVDPKKGMLFNPEESIDFNGNTGPFIQYTYARIQSLLKKGASFGLDVPWVELSSFEKKLIIKLAEFKELISDSAENHSPALIANYVYQLCKLFNQFYQNCKVIDPEEIKITQFRLALAGYCASIIKKSAFLLGFDVPNKM